RRTPCSPNRARAARGAGRTLPPLYRPQRRTRRQPHDAQVRDPLRCPPPTRRRGPPADDRHREHPGLGAGPQHPLRGSRPLMSPSLREGLGEGGFQSEISNLKSSSSTLRTENPALNPENPALSRLQPIKDQPCYRLVTDLRRFGRFKA